MTAKSTQAPGLVAAGTVIWVPAAPRRRLWLAAELVLLFVGAPLAIYYAVHGAKVPVFLALVPVLVFAIVALAADSTFRLKGELRRGFGWHTGVTILLVFLVFGGGLSYWIAENRPHWFLEFPQNRPKTYWRIMLLYPLASVAAQELVYRSFYFHRYGPLFGSWVWLGIILNGFLFGFCHIVMDSGFAVAATTIGGLVLAIRYAMCTSYWAVFIEHTLWGWLVFTVGLGRFFFTGISNVP